MHFAPLGLGIEPCEGYRHFAANAAVLLSGVGLEIAHSFTFASFLSTFAWCRNVQHVVSRLSGKTIRGGRFVLNTVS